MRKRSLGGIVKNNNKKIFVSLTMALSLVASSIFYSANTSAAIPVGSNYNYTGKVGSKGIDHYIAKHITLSNNESFALERASTPAVMYRLSANGEIISTIDPSSELGYWNPSDMAIDKDDNIFVADTNSRIVKFNKNGEYISQIKSNDSDINKRITRPTDIDIADNGDLYILDNADNTSATYDKIKVFTSDGTFIRSFGKYGSANDSIRTASAVKYYNNEVYVLDRNFRSIKIFDSTGVYQRKIDDTQISYQTDIFIKNDEIYFNINTGINTIKKYSVSGAFIGSQAIDTMKYINSISATNSNDITVFGDYKFFMRSNSSGQITTEKEINLNHEDSIYEPRALANDVMGNVFVLDSRASYIDHEDGSYEEFVKVFKFDINRKLIKSKSITIRKYDAEGNGFYANSPSDIAIDNEGNVLILGGYQIYSDGGNLHESYLVANYGDLESGSPISYEGQNNEGQLWSSYMTISNDSLYLSGGSMYDPETSVSYNVINFDMGSSDYRFYVPINTHSGGENWNIYAYGKVSVKDKKIYIAGMGSYYNEQTNESSEYTLTSYDIDYGKIDPLIVRYTHDEETNIDENNYFSTSTTDKYGNIYLIGERYVYNFNTNETAQYSIVKYDVTSGEISPIVKTGQGDGKEEDLYPYNYSISTDQYGNIYAIDGYDMTIKQYLRQANPPSVPQNLSTSSLDNSISLNWESPADDGGAPITDYIVRYRVSGSDSWTEVLVDGKTYSLKIDNVDPGSSYDIQVIARNYAGDSPPAETFVVSEIIDVPNTGFKI